MKINFTRQHFERLKELAFALLINNETIPTRLGGQLNIVELLHTLTVGSLNGIRLALGKQIEAVENKDEWVADDNQQKQLESLKNKKELVNLIIGWKRYKLEKEETRRKQAELKKQLQTLKESQKTPEDKIKELEAQLSELDATEEF